MTAAASARDGSRDFDFLVGRWRAESRRLARPLTGSNEWQTFTSTHDGIALPGRLGIADDFRVDGRDVPLGLALQFYDAASGQWRCHWVAHAGAAMSAPLVGAFVDGTGTFEGPDVHEGRPIRTRYTWSGITATTARWEQAYSDDGGRTWESNWVMEYTRVEG